jgi:hypothetical protein
MHSLFKPRAGGNVQMPRQSTSSLPSTRPSTDTALRKVKYAGRSAATVLRERVWPNARELSNPRIDKAAVEEALNECLSLLGAPQRPLRWFPDAETARPALRPYEFCKAYWPLWHAVAGLDEAWRAMMPAPVDSPRVSHPRRTAFDDTPREALANIGAMLHRLEGNGSSFKSLRSLNKPLPEGPLVAAFAAGLWALCVRPDQVACIPRPALWILNGRLHREDGAAVEWPTGERYFFWRGTRVPGWIIKRREQITLQAIRSEHNIEVRRCMIECFGLERFLQEAGISSVNGDQFGRLWWAVTGETWVEVENGTREADGTRRRYFLQVPRSMRSAREAVAWTYGLLPEQYELAVRT